MEKINLFLFNENSQASVYGIGSYLKELIYSLRNNEFNITMIFLRADQKVVSTENKDGVLCINIPVPLERAVHLDYDERTEQYYKNVIYLLKTHVLNTNDLIFHLNYNQNRILANELKKNFKCKLVFTIHYLDWCFGSMGNVTQFRSMLSNQKENKDLEKTDTFYKSYQEEKELFDTVDHIICISKNTHQILLDDYLVPPQKMAVIYNGLSCVKQNMGKSELRKKYRIPDVPIIIFAGRLDGIKGLEYAIQAFKKVIKNGPHCHMLIAGNGNFNRYMEECEDIWMYITWTGLIDKTKLYDMYSIADIGVMPSFHEQCSYVAIEMMMHGIPLIASTSTGLYEMVEGNITGLHIPVVEYPDKVEIDSSQLAEKMLYLLQHPEERILMGANARKRYEEHYSSEIMGKKMIDLYKSMI